MSRIFISGIFGFGDLGKFCDLWLQTGCVVNVNYEGDNGVDFHDFARSRVAGGGYIPSAGS